MKPASEPRPRSETRVLVVEASGETRLAKADHLAELFGPGDLLVVNDAATIPASLPAHTASGARVELRLAGNVEGARRWTAALLGAGDHRSRTEDRPPPPAVAVGDRLLIDGPDGLVAVVSRVHALSPRLLDVTLALPLLRQGADDASIWRALYRSGRPVQYAHVSRPLALWDVQNAWAARPWAVEMPSAGRVLGLPTIRRLRARGAEVAWITHAAGLSSVGDQAIDEALPLPERYEIPAETAASVARARRVVAVGTSVVRALESAAIAGGGVVVPGAATTDLVLGRGSPRRVVDALLTGVHDAGTTHHALLGAFAAGPVLEEALRTSVSEDLFGHELGDAWLVWGRPRGNSRRATPAGVGGDEPTSPVISAASDRRHDPALFARRGDGVDALLRVRKPVVGEVP